MDEVAIVSSHSYELSKRSAREDVMHGTSLLSELRDESRVVGLAGPKKACELGSPVAIKADKYDMPAARNWQNYSGEADSVKIYTRVEFACQIFCAIFVAVYATLSHK